MAKKTSIKTKDRRPARRSAPAVRAVARAPREKTAAATTDAAKMAASDSARGKYMYCVIQSADSLKFGAVGIGDNGSEIHTVHYRDLAAVVSDVPLGILDSTREN